MADGAPVAVLARSQNPAIERSPGPDLVIPLCREAARRGWPVYMFGTREDVLAAGAERLKLECPGLDIRESRHRRSATIRVPMLRMPPPTAWPARAQRSFCSALDRRSRRSSRKRARRHPELGLVCIGAALDFMTGEQMPAPAVMRNNGLEWLWRLATSPRPRGTAASNAPRCSPSLPCADARGRRPPAEAAIQKRIRAADAMTAPRLRYHLRLPQKRWMRWQASSDPRWPWRRKSGRRATGRRPRRSQRPRLRFSSSSP